MKTLGLRIADIVVQVNDDGSAELTSSLHSDNEEVQKQYDALETNILLDYADGRDILAEDYRVYVEAEVGMINTYEEVEEANIVLGKSVKQGIGNLQ